MLRFCDNEKIEFAVIADDEEGIVWYLDRTDPPPREVKKRCGKVKN